MCVSTFHDAQRLVPEPHPPQRANPQKLVPRFRGTPARSPFPQRGRQGDRGDNPYALHTKTISPRPSENSEGGERGVWGVLGGAELEGWANPQRSLHGITSCAADPGRGEHCSPVFNVAKRLVPTKFVQISTDDQWSPLRSIVSAPTFTSSLSFCLPLQNSFPSLIHRKRSPFP